MRTLVVALSTDPGTNLVIDVPSGGDVEHGSRHLFNLIIVAVVDLGVRGTALKTTALARHGSGNVGFVRLLRTVRGVTVTFL